MLINYEIGFNIKVNKKIKIEPSLYFSKGKNLIYFVATGDSVDTGGASLKPILRKSNISSVEVYGGEINITYNINKNIIFRTNYSYNDSKIKEFNIPEDDVNKDLSGKYLIEVPKHIAYAGIFWNNKYFNASASYVYYGDQWYDDENTQTTDAYDIFDVKISKKFYKKIFINLSVQNVFDNVYVDRKGRLSPGRFITGEVVFKF